MTPCASPPPPPPLNAPLHMYWMIPVMVEFISIYCLKNAEFGHAVTNFNTQSVHKGSFVLDNKWQPFYKFM